MPHRNIEHGPENAEREIRIAYNEMIDAVTTHFWDRRSIPGVNADEVLTIYKKSFQAYRKGDRLAAERWARTAKHLARAFLHEAKIAYLEPRIGEVPYLEGASAEELGLREHSNTTADLLDSVADHIPPGLEQMPEEMNRYLSRGRKHLQVIQDKDYGNEVLRAERIKAAYEYGRVLECIALAYEAEALHPKAA